MKILIYSLFFAGSLLITTNSFASCRNIEGVYAVDLASVRGGGVDTSTIALGAVQYGGEKSAFGADLLPNIYNSWDNYVTSPSASNRWYFVYIISTAADNCTYHEVVPLPAINMTLARMKQYMQAPSMPFARADETINLVSDFHVSANNPNAFVSENSSGPSDADAAYGVHHATWQKNRSLTVDQRGNLLVFQGEKTFFFFAILPFWKDNKTAAYLQKVQ